MRFTPSISLFVTMVTLLIACTNIEESQENKSLSDELKSDTTVVLNHIDKAVTFTDNIPDSVLFYANKALKLSENINYNFGIALSNYYLGAGEWAKGNYLKSIEFYKKTVALTNNKQLRALAQRDISLSLIYLGENDEAKAYLDESIIIFKEINDKYALTLAYINYGMIESRQENFLLALEHYQEALKLSDETNNLKNKSLILNNLGVINSSLEMHSLSLDYYQQAYDIIKKSEDLKLKALYLNNIANIHIELGNYNKALKLIDTGLLITEESDDKRSKIFLLSNKGEALLKKEKPRLAIDFLNNAYDISEQTGIYENILTILNGLGTAYYKIENFNKAMTYFNEALEKAESEDDKESIKETSEMIAKIHSSKGDFKKAFQYMTQSNEMADSLSKSKIVKQFTQMEMQFDFDKKVYESELIQQKAILENKQKLDRQRFLLYVFIVGFIIILLFVILIYRNYRIIRKLNAQLKNSVDKTTEQNRLIEKKNQDLESLNNTKDKLFSIIAHDLNSPFNTILGFTEMFSDKYNELNEAKRKHYLNQIYQSSKDAYYLLKNLLIWARSQKDNIEIEPELVELNGFVQLSLEPFMHSAKEKNIKVLMELPDIQLNLDKFTMQSTLVNLFNNAIKFTKSGGQISISGFKRSSSIEIKISDNGVGIPQKRLNSLFKIGTNQSSMGTNNEKGTGLGLIICKEFVTKNKGKLKVESKVGRGSTFTIILPLK